MTADLLVGTAGLIVGGAGVALLVWSIRTSKILRAGQEGLFGRGLPSAFSSPSAVRIGAIFVMAFGLLLIVLSIIALASL